MYNGIKINIAVVIYSVHVYNMILVSGHKLCMFLVVFLLSVHVCVCVCVDVCVCTCLCKPQYSLAEHNTHCMYKPRLRASVDWRLLLPGHLLMVSCCKCICLTCKSFHSHCPTEHSSSLIPATTTATILPSTAQHNRKM